ncbi:MAG: hypothetical protein ACRDHV_00850 [Actinomycetota bacterium]
MDEGTRLLREEAHRVAPPTDPFPGIMERLSRKRRRRRVAAAATAMAVAAGGLLVAYVAFEDRQPRPASEPGGTGRVTAAIDVDGLPRDVAAGEGRIWVVGHQVVLADGTVWPDDVEGATGDVQPAVLEGRGSEDAVLQAIDPSSNEVVLRVSLKDQLGRDVSPGLLAVGEGAVWVSESRGGWIHRIDPVTGEVTRSLRAPRSPISVLQTGGGYLWYVAEGDPRVDREPRWEAELVKVDPVTLDSVATTPIGPCCAGDLVEEGGSLWLGHQVVRDSDYSLEVLRIDPGSARVVDRVALDRGQWTPGDTLLGYMAASPGSVWVPRPEAGIVDRIDSATGAVADHVEIGAFALPDGAAWYAGSVWVGSLGGTGLARIDPGTGRVTVEDVGVSELSHLRAATAEALWLVRSDRGEVLRVELGGPVPSPQVVKGLPPDSEEEFGYKLPPESMFRPLGREGCRPPSPLVVTESLATSVGIKVWALLTVAEVAKPPWELAAGDEVKIVWRSDGSGDFDVVAISPTGEVVPSEIPVTSHLSSNWERPGSEWESWFTFSEAGCWELRVRHGDGSARLWLMIDE